MKTTYPQTGPRRRRIIFADGSQVIVSSSGYGIFEGIPKVKTARLKTKPTPPASSALRAPRRKKSPARRRTPAATAGKTNR